MKTLYLFVFLLSGMCIVHAQTPLTINGSTTGSSTVYVNSGAVVYVEGGINILQNGSPATDSNKYLQNNGTIQLVSDGTPGQSNFTNNVSGLKTYTSGQTTGTIIFAANNETQTVSGGGTAEFMNLTVNNTTPPTVALGENVTVDGALTIGGVIKTQSNNLTLASSGTLAGSPFTSANMIQADGSGQFLQGVKSGAGSYLFPVGDGAPAYSPVTINFVSNANAGVVGINVTASTHPQINNPTAALDNLSRYWSFTNTGLSTYSYTGTFNYLSTDIVGTESKLKLSRWANPWYEDEASSAASDVLTITTAINQTLAPLSGDFTGRFACPYPAITVNPQSAVCTGNTFATLTASGAVSYTWAPNTNISNSTGATVTAQISQLTFYTVTGTGSTGCTTTAIVPVATVATGGTISPLYSIICSGNTKTLTVTGAAGHDYQWQISSDNSNWGNINGATNTTYTTASSDGNINEFYRLLSNSNACWNVASTTAEVDVSQPVITVTATNITDNSLTLNWSPTGTGNYSISYSGTSSATLTSVTPAKTITGLTADGTYSITVTQTGVAGCPASGVITGVNTLCAMPTGVTLSSPAATQLLVSWTGVPGADYRVYYRPLFSYTAFFSKDVINGSSVLITKQGNNNLYGGDTYEVYVSRLDCPTAGAVGQGTNPTNVLVLPTVSCATPVIDSVRSTCAVQLEVYLHPGSSPTGAYNIYIQRVTPTVLAVNSYGINSNYFTVNTPYAGDVYLIAADSKCAGGALSSLAVWPGNVTIKPLCTSPSNLVLSNPTCHGFTASWNSDQCITNSASGYQIAIRRVGSINYNSYNVGLPANGIGPHETINWFPTGTSYQAFVRTYYNCNGYLTYGPSSQIETITTLSSGCRDEEDAPVQENKPAAQQYSSDNQEVFSLYPNPNSGEFMVDLSRFGMEEDAVRIEVINMIGQTVITHLTTISGGHLNEFINLPNGTAAGTYIVRLTAGNNVYTAKINVSK